MPDVGVPAAMRTALDRAAPVYRRLWWPAHGRRSRTFVDELQTWLRLEGAVIVAFVTWAYGNSGRRRDSRWRCRRMRTGPARARPAIGSW